MTRIKPWGPTDTHTTSDSLDRLWDVVNRRRDGTKEVKVPVDDLIDLLKDHAQFCNVVKTTS